MPTTSGNEGPSSHGGHGNACDLLLRVMPGRDTALRGEDQIRGELFQESGTLAHGCMDGSHEGFIEALGLCGELHERHDRRSLRLPIALPSRPGVVNVLGSHAGTLDERQYRVQPEKTLGVRLG